MIIFFTVKKQTKQLEIVKKKHVWYFLGFFFLYFSPFSQILRANLSYTKMIQSFTIQPEPAGLTELSLAGNFDTGYLGSVTLSKFLQWFSAFLTQKPSGLVFVVTV